VEHVKAEKQIMSMIEHPFIVNLLGAFQALVTIEHSKDFFEVGASCTNRSKAMPFFQHLSARTD